MSRFAGFSGSMVRRAVCAAAFVQFGVSLAMVFGQTGGTYQPGPSPMLTPILWLCVEDIPAPQTRTDFGIDEQVTFWIDPSSWYDQDIYIDSYGNQTTVYDSMGIVTWTATGAGTVCPLTGNSTTLTVDEVAQDSQVGVQAQIPDSGTKGLDPPVFLQGPPAPGGGMGRVPQGIQGVQWSSDTPLGVVGPPNNQIGAHSTFWYQVTPATVNFRKMGTKFQENIPAMPLPPPYIQPIWPDGKTPVTSPARVRGFKVNNIAFKTPGGQILTFPNEVLDDVQTGPHPVGQLGTPPQAFSYTIPVPLDYFGGGVWNRMVLTNNKWHPRSFQANLQSQVAIDPGTGPVWGGLQGPYK